MIKINKRRNTNRIPQHDYSTPGQYFITICAENRQELFGTIENDQMALNNVGNIINIWWQKIFETYQNITIDKYVIMPNHIHGIINIVGVNPCVDPIQNEKLYKNQKVSYNGRTHGSAPTISDMIKWFKTMTTNQIKTL